MTGLVRRGAVAWMQRRLSGLAGLVRVEAVLEAIEVLDDLDELASGALGDAPWHAQAFRERLEPVAASVSMASIMDSAGDAQPTDGPLLAREHAAVVLLAALRLDAATKQGPRLAEKVLGLLVIAERLELAWQRIAAGADDDQLIELLGSDAPADLAGAGRVACLRAVLDSLGGLESAAEWRAVHAFDPGVELERHRLRGATLTMDAGGASSAVLLWPPERPSDAPRRSMVQLPERGTAKLKLPDTATGVVWLSLVSHASDPDARRRLLGRMPRPFAWARVPVPVEGLHPVASAPVRARAPALSALSLRATLGGARLSWWGQGVDAVELWRDGELWRIEPAERGSSRGTVALTLTQPTVLHVVPRHGDVRGWAWRRRVLPPAVPEPLSIPLMFVRPTVVGCEQVAARLTRSAAESAGKTVCRQAVEHRVLPGDLAVASSTNELLAGLASEALRAADGQPSIWAALIPAGTGLGPRAIGPTLGAVALIVGAPEDLPELLATVVRRPRVIDAAVRVCGRLGAQLRLESPTLGPVLQIDEALPTGFMLRSEVATGAPIATRPICRLHDPSEARREVYVEGAVPWTEQVDRVTLLSPSLGAIKTWSIPADLSHDPICLRLALARPIVLVLPAVLHANGNLDAVPDRYILGVLSRVGQPWVDPSAPAVKLPWLPDALAVVVPGERMVDDLLAGLATLALDAEGLDDALWLAVLPEGNIERGALDERSTAGAWRIAVASPSGVEQHLPALLRDSPGWEVASQVEALRVSVRRGAARVEFDSRPAPSWAAANGEVVAFDGEQRRLHTGPAWVADDAAWGLIEDAPAVVSIEVHHDGAVVARARRGEPAMGEIARVELAEDSPHLVRWRADPPDFLPTALHLEAAISRPGASGSQARAWVRLCDLPARPCYFELPPVPCLTELRLVATNGWSRVVGPSWKSQGEPSKQRAWPLRLADGRLAAVVGHPAQPAPHVTWSADGRRRTGFLFDGGHGATVRVGLPDGRQMILQKPEPRHGAASIVLIRSAVVGDSTATRAGLDDVEARCHFIIEPPLVPDELAALRRLPTEPSQAEVEELLGALSLFAVQSPGGEDSVWLALLPGPGTWNAWRGSAGARAVAVCPVGGLAGLLGSLPKARPRRAVDVLRVVGHVDGGGRLRIDEILLEQRPANPTSPQNHALGIVLRRRGLDDQMPQPFELAQTGSVRHRFFGLFPCEADLSGFVVIEHGRVLVARARTWSELRAPTLTWKRWDELTWSVESECGAPLVSHVEVRHAGIRIRVGSLVAPHARWVLPRDLGPHDTVHVLLSDGWAGALGSARRHPGARASATRGPSLRWLGSELWLDRPRPSSEHVVWNVAGAGLERGTTSLQLKKTVSGWVHAWSDGSIEHPLCVVAEAGQLSTVPLCSAGVLGLCVVASGQVLLTEVDGTVRCVELEQGRELWREQENGAPVQPCVQPDGPDAAWIVGKTVVRRRRDGVVRVVAPANGVQRIAWTGSDLLILTTDGCLWRWSEGGALSAATRRGGWLGLVGGDAGQAAAFASNWALWWSSHDAGPRTVRLHGEPDCVASSRDSLLAAGDGVLAVHRVGLDTVECLALDRAAVIAVGVDEQLSPWAVDGWGEVWQWTPGTAQPRRLATGTVPELVVSGRRCLALIGTDRRIAMVDHEQGATPRTLTLPFDISRAAWMGERLILAAWAEGASRYFG